MDALTAHGLLDGLTLVDVREAYEFKGGHISGSKNIPLGELPSRTDDLDADARILTVCKVGARSDEAARFLQAFGLQAENLDGGVIAWAEAGYELVTPDGDQGRVVY